jgi:hypothetical protein
MPIPSANRAKNPCLSFKRLILLEKFVLKQAPTVP